jgi:hypothetical protein
VEWRDIKVLASGPFNFNGKIVAVINIIESGARSLLRKQILCTCSVTLCA